MIESAWVIPILPLAAALFLLAAGNKAARYAAYIGSACSLAALICSIWVLAERLDGPGYKAAALWLAAGDGGVYAGFEVSKLNALMLVIVSLVSALVHIYSMAYMKGEERFGTYYAYLGFFTFAMLGTVLSPNLLQLYIFWELVGLGSFLLIGFYFTKESARKAAKKAFIMTRIGDAGLLAAIILLFLKTGSFEFQDIFEAAESGILSPSMITLTALLIFLGAVGKSGQFPLHSWLPDAMEGPTPVSALIHAATMVAAGVYLTAVMYPLFAASEAALGTVAVIGGLTALFAATIALVQTDIKRILAYSTISQLGYMMLALGTGGYTAAIFHLMTHAFFKALLFLAAGSVIHAIHTQDIREMGGLWKKMRYTGPLFLAGTLAISGVPLFSGFFSKDAILLSVWLNGSWFLFIIACLTAFLTAFYMFRLFFLIFAGKPQSGEIKEAPLPMLLPMAVLGFLAVFSGYADTPSFGSFLGSWLASGNDLLPAPVHENSTWWIAAAASLVSAGGIFLAYLIYVKGSIQRDWLAPEGGTLQQILINKYFIDEIYLFTIGKFTAGAALFCSYAERFIIGGLEQAVTETVTWFGRVGARLQSGHVQLYGTAAAALLAVLLVIYAWTGGLIR